MANVDIPPLPPCQNGDNNHKASLCPLPQSPQSSPPDAHINPTRSLQYWNQTPASLTGMLGGYPQISRIDLQGSRSFLAKLHRSGSGTGHKYYNYHQHQQRASNGTFTTSHPSRGGRGRLKRAVDCGAGIGRVTDGLLRHVCEKVDVVEPVAKFAETLRQESRTAADGKVGKVFVCGLEEWDPRVAEADSETEVEEEEERGNYDLIWNQWCLGHLKDTELTDYLRRCRDALRWRRRRRQIKTTTDKNHHDDKNDEASEAEAEAEAETSESWIVIKENLSTDPESRDVYDELDSSVTRTDAKFRALFEEAGLVVVRSELQTGFPRGLGLYPVRMYGLKRRKEEKREKGGRMRESMGKVVEANTARGYR